MTDFLVISFPFVIPSRSLPVICIGEEAEEELDAAEGVDEETFRARNDRVLCCAICFREETKEELDAAESVDEAVDEEIFFARILCCVLCCLFAADLLF